MPTSYQVRVDWDGSGSFLPGVDTGSSVGVAVTSTAFDVATVLTASAGTVPVGTYVVLCDSTGTVLEDRLHLVWKQESGFGFTNLSLNPPCSVLPASGNTLHVYTPDGTDVTLDRLATTLTVSYGRDSARTLSSVAAGTGSFDLDNRTRKYWPDNTSSTLYPNVRPARPTYVFALLNGASYPLFRGHTDDFAPTAPGKNGSSVPISLLDGLADVQGVTISTALYQGIRTGVAINAILDQVGWPANMRDIDPGATVMPYWWLSQADAGQAIQDLVNSEGPGSIVTIDGAGNFLFRDRHHRITRSASINVQNTWHETGSDPRFSWPITYDAGWKDIINSVSISVQTRTASATLVSVWSTGDTFNLLDGQSVSLFASASDPFVQAQVPVAGVDYIVQSGAATVALSRDSGSSAVLTLTAVGGPAVVVGMNLNAYPFLVTNTQIVLVEDSTSIQQYGKRSYSQDAPWVNTYDAQAIASVIIALRAQRLPVVQVVLKNTNDTMMTEILSRDLSDRIHLTSAEMGVDADFFIERIEHAITGQGQLTHTATFSVEQAPTVPSNLFRFDTAGAGFNQGVFAGDGLNDPNTVFRFDTAGHGFDQGVFAT